MFVNSVQGNFAKTVTYTLAKNARILIHGSRMNLEWISNKQNKKFKFTMFQENKNKYLVQG